MLHMTLVLEDTILSANESHDKAKGDWHIRCVDVFSGKSAEAYWSCYQLAAVTALAHGFGEHNGCDEAATEVLYKIARDAIKDWPKEVRPIP